MSKIEINREGNILTIHRVRARETERDGIGWTGLFDGETSVY